MRAVTITGGGASEAVTVAVPWRHNRASYKTLRMSLLTIYLEVSKYKVYIKKNYNNILDIVNFLKPSSMQSILSKFG